MSRRAGHFAFRGRPPMRRRESADVRRPARAIRPRIGIPSWVPLGLTRRGLVLAGVLVALLAMAVYPIRSYADQRAQLQQLEARDAQLNASIASLRQQEQRLQDPTYVDVLAERDLHMVRPGEQLFVLVGHAPVGPAVPPAAVPAPGASGAWYQRLLQRLADWLSG